ncbi:MAG: diaminopimelate epimerase [Parasporobacterium sp.]|nr:diaminopimelate epimerase [Parasporobacterium sp.]
MRFTKMHGCGNDYIYIDNTEGENLIGPGKKPELVRRLSDRHFGIGGDGVIFINRSDAADFEMEMYNADGSRGRMCGNGIRCVAKYVFDHGLTMKNPMTIESFGSVKTLSLTLENGKVSRVTVDMGEAEIPEIQPDIPGVTAVSMGNPHAVLFTEDPQQLDLTVLGPEMEHHPAFPEGVNTEFVQVIDRTHLRMRVWERGSGETLACGTGACASVVAAVLKGRTERQVTAALPGGELEIEWRESDGHVLMTGPAREVFTGTMDLADL